MTDGDGEDDEELELPGLRALTQFSRMTKSLTEPFRALQVASLASSTALHARVVGSVAGRTELSRLVESTRLSAGVMEALGASKLAGLTDAVLATSSLVSSIAGLSLANGVAVRAGLNQAFFDAANVAKLSAASNIAPLDVGWVNTLLASSKLADLAGSGLMSPRWPATTFGAGSVDLGRTVTALTRVFAISGSMEAIAALGADVEQVDRVAAAGAGIAEVVDAIDEPDETQRLVAVAEAVRRAVQTSARRKSISKCGPSDDDHLLRMDDVVHPDGLGRPRVGKLAKEGCH